MAKDVFTAFDNAEKQYELGNTNAWDQYMKKMRREGNSFQYVAAGLWCLNDCILLHEEVRVDATEIL